MGTQVPEAALRREEGLSTAAQSLASPSSVSSLSLPSPFSLRDVNSCLRRWGDVETGASRGDRKAGQGDAVSAAACPPRRAHAAKPEKGSPRVDMPTNGDADSAPHSTSPPCVKKENAHRSAGAPSRAASPPAASSSASPGISASAGSAASSAVAAAAPSASPGFSGGASDFPLTSPSLTALGYASRLSEHPDKGPVDLPELEEDAAVLKSKLSTLCALFREEAQRLSALHLGTLAGCLPQQPRSGDSPSSPSSSSSSSSPSSCSPAPSSSSTSSSSFSVSSADASVPLQPVEDAGGDASTASVSRGEGQPPAGSETPNGGEAGDAQLSRDVESADGALKASRKGAKKAGKPSKKERENAPGGACAHTGAGVSTSAGILDFRGPSGVWTLEAKGQELSDGAKDTMEVAFGRHRRPVREFHLALPTLTHLLLRTLATAPASSWVAGVGEASAACSSSCPPLLRYIITQNVDGLHARCGTPFSRLGEVHGSMFTERCDFCARRFLRDFPLPTLSFAPTGRLCGLCAFPPSGVCTDVLLDWHDRYERVFETLALRNTRAASLHLCLGSSLQIQPACHFPGRERHRQSSLVIANLQATPLDRQATLCLRYTTDGVSAALAGALFERFSGERRRATDARIAAAGGANLAAPERGEKLAEEAPHGEGGEALARLEGETSRRPQKRSRESEREADACGALSEEGHEERDSTRRENAADRIATDADVANARGGDGAERTVRLRWGWSAAGGRWGCLFSEDAEAATAGVDKSAADERQRGDSLAAKREEDTNAQPRERVGRGAEEEDTEDLSAPFIRTSLLFVARLPLRALPAAAAPCEPPLWDTGKKRKKRKTETKKTQQVASKTEAPKGEGRPRERARRENEADGEGDTDKDVARPSPERPSTEGECLTVSETEAKNYDDDTLAAWVEAHYAQDVREASTSSADAPDGARLSAALPEAPPPPLQAASDLSASVEASARAQRVLLRIACGLKVEELAAGAAQRGAEATGEEGEGDWRRAATPRLAPRASAGFPDSRRARIQHIDCLRGLWTVDFYRDTRLRLYLWYGTTAELRLFYSPEQRALEVDVWQFQLACTPGTCSASLPPSLVLSPSPSLRPQPANGERQIDESGEAQKDDGNCEGDAEGETPDTRRDSRPNLPPGRSPSPEAPPRLAAPPKPAAPLHASAASSASAAQSASAAGRPASRRASDAPLYREGPFALEERRGQVSLLASASLCMRGAFAPADLPRRAAHLPHAAERQRKEEERELSAHPDCRRTRLVACLKAAEEGGAASAAARAKSQTEGTATAPLAGSPKYRELPLPDALVSLYRLHALATLPLMRSDFLEALRNAKRKRAPVHQSSPHPPAPSCSASALPCGSASFPGLPSSSAASSASPSNSDSPSPSASASRYPLRNRSESRRASPSSAALPQKKPRNRAEACVVFSSRELPFLLPLNSEENEGANNAATSLLPLVPRERRREEKRRGFRSHEASRGEEEGNALAAETTCKEACTVKRRCGEAGGGGQAEWSPANQMNCEGNRGAELAAADRHDTREEERNNETEEIAAAQGERGEVPAWESIEDEVTCRPVFLICSDFELGELLDLSREDDAIRALVPTKKFLTSYSSRLAPSPAPASLLPCECPLPAPPCLSSSSSSTSSEIVFSSSGGRDARPGGAQTEGGGATGGGSRETPATKKTSRNRPEKNAVEEANRNTLHATWKATYLALKRLQRANRRGSHAPTPASSSTALRPLDSAACVEQSEGSAATEKTVLVDATVWQALRLFPMWALMYCIDTLECV
ncbi:putative histone deacetylase [Besnoitia besnoiti]|uniref:protein acetyllysine N-acetyltransferase n=1 Tax=Besnoitia besnoiti TaxID=94643 RepID=A0A2A9MM73_BESBE|nr:putative histone deacetylase [Besnoitia besnoiti]PFH36847.1 putative histone deacetylase [Besnoitia besnoiti]